MRFLLTIWLLSLVAMANMDIYPKKECELFNNLKHTKNRGHQVLDLTQPYEMLKHHKRQYLVKVEGATPAQRWVNDDCLSLRPLRNSPLYGKTDKPKSVQKRVTIEEELSRANKHMAQKPQKVVSRFNHTRVSSKQNLLALSWHNAFCETHRYKKECKRGLGNLLKRKASDTQFVLHGLWPQPRSNVYCNVEETLKNLDKNKRWRDLPCLSLDKSTEDALAKVMPGFKSQLHKHEWIKHGTCYGTDANRYYSDAVNLVNQVNNSALGKFFTQNIGKKITLKQVRSVADRAFGRGAGSRIELQCRKGLVTELWLHLGSGGTDLSSLLKKGKKTNSRCKQGRIDKAGFGR